MAMAGLLPRKTREAFSCPRTLRVHGSMENCAPFYRRKDQEEG
jgi:hypothetical protein